MPTQPEIQTTRPRETQGTPDPPGKPGRFTAEPINRVIAAKAERNQAGSLPGEKWLVVYLDSVYAIAAALSIEAFMKSRESWLAFESKIDRRHFEEVWLVWDERRLQQDIADFGQQVNVVRFTPRDSHRAVCEWPTTRREISSD